MILCVGIRPATEFLNGSGIEMEKGAIVVDDTMSTNLPDVYAAGDCALVKNRVTGARQWSAMGSTANIAARIMAKGICGGTQTYPAALAPAWQRSPRI